MTGSDWPPDHEFGAEPQSVPETPPEPNPVPEASERLESRVVAYWITSGTLVLAFLITGILVGAWWLAGRHEEHAFWIRFGSYSLAGSLALTALLEPILSYRFWRYTMDDELLVMRYGILFREEKVIPISRLQHVDLRRGPIERLFRLATLVVFTAGTEGATFRVPGLSVARAREMRDRVLAARGDDVI